MEILTDVFVLVFLQELFVVVFEVEVMSHQGLLEHLDW